MDYVLTGLDRIREGHWKTLKGYRLGLLSNQASLDNRLNSAADVISGLLPDHLKANMEVSADNLILFMSMMILIKTHLVGDMIILIIYPMVLMLLLKILKLEILLLQEIFVLQQYL